MDIIVLSDKVAEYVKRAIEFPCAKLDVSIQYDIKRMGYLFQARARLPFSGQLIQCEYFYHGNDPEFVIPAIAGVLAESLNDSWRERPKLLEGKVIHLRPVKFYKAEQFEPKAPKEPEGIFPPWD